MSDDTARAADRPAWMDRDIDTIASVQGFFRWAEECADVSDKTPIFINVGYGKQPPEPALVERWELTITDDDQTYITITVRA